MRDELLEALDLYKAAIEKRTKRRELPRYECAYEWPRLPPRLRFCTKRGTELPRADGSAYTAYLLQHSPSRVDQRNAAWCWERAINAGHVDC